MIPDPNGRGLVPSPDEIRRECVEIQATWSPDDEAARRNFTLTATRTSGTVGVHTGGPCQPYEFPLVRA